MLPPLGHSLRLCLRRFRSGVTQQGAWGYNSDRAEGERRFFSGSQCHFVLYIMDEHGEVQDLNALVCFTSEFLFLLLVIKINSSEISEIVRAGEQELVA